MIRLYKYSMTKMNTQFMEKACDLASHSVENGGGPFGCVIVDSNNSVIGEGYNMVTINNDPTQHAEIVAIRNACNNLNNFSLENCTLYTSCEPCPMCLGAIYWARIKKIYYGNNRQDAANIGFDDKHIYDEIKNDIFSNRQVPIEQLCADYAKCSFELWRKKENKIEY
jgi:guanine deaminase